MKRFLRRLLSVLTSRRDDRELSREMDAHLALLEDEYRRRGMSAADAALAARRAVGSVALARDRHRDARSFAWLDDARQDLRFALRMLTRAPGFAAVVIVTMALSVGATTTLFSVAYGVLMRPLPWSDADRLVRLQETRGGRPSRVAWTISNGTYLAWREKPSTVEGIGGWLRSGRRTIATDRDTDRLMIGVVTPSLFRVIRARPEIGRLFLDDESAQTRVLILGYGLWQRRFGGRSDIIGTSVGLDGQPFTIVGVMPRGFSFPNLETEAWTAFGVPQVMSPDGKTIRLTMFSAMARLRPGVTPEQAATEAAGAARSAPDLKQAATALFGSNGVPGMMAAPALDVMTADVRPALMILLAAVGLLFVASTASLVVLQLSRVAKRRREIAVRTAIGAGAARLIRQWLVESTMLGMAGAGAGLAAALTLHRGLPALLPAGFPRVEDVRLDWRVAAFACVVACLASLACGMVPAFGRRDHVVDALGEGAATAPAVTRTPAARVRVAFMAAQVAVACILLIGASLLMRSFLTLLDVDRGFDPRGVLTMRIPLPPKSTFADRQDMLDRVQQRLSAWRGVTDVAFGNALPFVTPGGYRGMSLRLPTDPSITSDVQVTQRVVSPEYFRAMRLRVIQGRPLEATDIATSPPVMVVNRTFASRHLGDHPVGQRLDLNFQGSPTWEVVGVVDDMRQGSNLNDPSATFGGVLDPPQAEIFLPHRQWSFTVEDLIVVVRTTTDPAALASFAREVVRAEDPTLPVDSVMTMEERVASSLAGPRTYAVFLIGFALCALAIAGVGLFGVLSYTTAQRTREIGLRTALGAQRGDVLTLVSRQALGMTVGGLAAGLVAAFFLSRTLTTLLYGVSARDAISFVMVPVVLLLVSLLACVVPAMRATRINPIDALRSS
jgi:putative ABC transport system permease protein